MTTKDARKLSRFFFAGAADCEVDKQGRILLPAVLRDFAAIGKEVVLVGVLNRVEIWSILYEVIDLWNYIMQGKR